MPAGISVPSSAVKVMPVTTSSGSETEAVHPGTGLVRAELMPYSAGTVSATSVVPTSSFSFGTRNATAP